MFKWAIVLPSNLECHVANAISVEKESMYACPQVNTRSGVWLQKPICTNHLGIRYNLCAEVRFLATPPVHGSLQRYLVHAADFCYVSINLSFYFVPPFHNLYEEFA